METEEPGDAPVFKKSSAKYIVFYHVISLPIIVYIIHSEQYRSGPCNPGLDILAYLGDWLVTVILLVVSLVSLAKSKSYRWAVLANLVAMGVLVFLN